MPSGTRAGTLWWALQARDKGLRSTLRQSANAMRAQQRAVHALKRDMQAFNRTARAMTASLFSMRGAVLGLLGVGGIAGLGRAFVEAADTMQLASSRLRVVTRDAEEFAIAQRRVFAVAQETRLPLDNLIDLYARVGRATREAGKTTEEIIPFIRAVSQAIIVSGSTAAEASAGLIQFSQGLAQNRLAGDEFRSVAEQLPRLAQAIADGLGLTLGQLRALAHAQQLTTELVFIGIARSAAQIEKEFRQIPRTVGQAVTQVRNQLLSTVNTLNVTTDSTEALVAAVDRFKAVAGRPDVASVLLAGVRRLVEALAFLLEHITAVGHAFKLLFAVALAQSRLGQLVVNLARVTLGMFSLRGAAAATAHTFLRFFTLPIGARLASGIETLQIHFLLLQDSASRAGAGIVAALRAPGVAVAGLSARVLTLRNALAVTGVVARTTFAVGMTAAAGAARLFAVAFRGAVSILRTFKPLLIIEGIIQIGSYLLKLGQQANNFSITFKTAAIVAGADFLEGLLDGMRRIPGLLARTMLAAVTASIEIAISGGRAIGLALRESIFNPTGAPFRIPRIIQKELADGLERALNAAAAQINRRDLELPDFPFAEALLRSAGLSREQIARARSANFRAVRDTKAAALELLGGAGQQQIGVPDLPTIGVPKPPVVPDLPNLAKGRAGPGTKSQSGPQKAQNEELERTLNFFRSLEDAGQRSILQAQQRLQLLGLEGEALAKQQARFEVINQVKERQLHLQKQLEDAKLSLAKELVTRDEDEINRAEQQLQFAEQAIAAFNQQKAGLDKIIAGYQEAAVAGRRLQLVAGLFREELTPLELYNEQLVILNNLLRQNIINFEKFFQLVKKAQDQFDKTTKKGRENLSLMKVIGDSLADGLANAAAHARNLKDALRSIALTLASTLLRTYLPQLIGRIIGAPPPRASTEAQSSTDATIWSASRGRSFSGRQRRGRLSPIISCDRRWREAVPRSSILDLSTSNRPTALAYGRQWRRSYRLSRAGSDVSFAGKPGPTCRGLPRRAPR